jgi:hypothetical protein
MPTNANLTDKDRRRAWYWSGLRAKRNAEIAAAIRLKQVLTEIKTAILNASGTPRSHEAVLHEILGIIWREERS